jgi:predicted nucleic-acid-binding protein
MNRSKRTAVIISAINQYLKDVGISDGAKSIIAVAINKYINDKANDNKAIIATAINKFIEDKED